MVPKVQRISALVLLRLPDEGSGGVAASHVRRRKLHSAVRPRISPGADFVATITATGSGGFGQLVDTIPDRFNHQPGCGSESGGQSLFFTLLGDETFTYTVTASGEEGVYAFSGVLKDSDKDERPVRGHSEVTVRLRPSANADTLRQALADALSMGLLAVDRCRQCARSHPTACGPTPNCASRS